MLYKDACNGKSNQQNLGTIKSSNLCTEIVEYTAPDEVAVCNLASVNLAAFVVTDDSNGGKSYDFQRLYEVTKVVAKNLNKVIDVNFYPIPEAKNSNMRHRPIGMGVQVSLLIDELYREVITLYCCTGGFLFHVEWCIR